MTIDLQQLDSSVNTFGDWFARTNEISEAMSNNVVTADGDSATSGYVEIEGQIRANTAYFDEIYGGSPQSANTIQFNSEVVFNEPITTTFLTTENIIITYGYDINCKIEYDGNISNVNNCYGGSSDERIKTEIEDSNSQWNDIKNLKIKKYKLKKDIELFGKNAPKKIGVIAQDLENVNMNGLVYENDGVKAVKYSVLYMKAIKALQEAMVRIENLEKSVKKLNAALSREK